MDGSYGSMGQILTLEWTGGKALNDWWAPLQLPIATYGPLYTYGDWSFGASTFPTPLTALPPHSPAADCQASIK